MSEFFTWSTLATYAGAVLATGIITQLLKSLFRKVPTRALSYLVAVVILLLATQFTTGLTWEAAVLCLINALVVSLAAQGGYEVGKNGVSGTGIKGTKKS